MWSWLTGGSGSGGRHRAGLGGFLSRPREFSLASMRHLHAQLLRFAELGDAEIVELLRVLSEFLVYSDQNHDQQQYDSKGNQQHNSGEYDDNERARESLESLEFTATTSGAGVFFDYFCEKNILALFVQLGEARPSVAVQIQLLQTMSILVQNIATRTSLYYLLSNNYVNKLLLCPFAVTKDDDVRDWYVTLLKALSLRLNEDTVQFFFDTREHDGAFFPLYTQALTFKRCPETMVKVAVKTLTLNVYKVHDDRVREFIVRYQKMAYFRDTVEYANELALKIQGLLNLWSPSMGATVIDKLEEAIDEYIDHCFYLQDILDINLPELCYKVGDLLYRRHVKRFLAASVLPDCNPPPQRVSTRLALYLLTRLTGIFEHAPLVNAVAFMLLSPDANEKCPYSAVALGAGSRRKSVRGKPLATTMTTPTTTAADKQVPALAAGDLTKTKRKSTLKTKKKKPAHVFQAHSVETCDSPLCYLQTRFDQGEWPLEEVEAFVPGQANNVTRQSILALLASSDELLSSAALLLLLAIVNNDAIDHTLLRELDLLPFRHRKRRRSIWTASELPLVHVPEGSDNTGDGDASGDEERGESSVVSSTSSSNLSVSSTSHIEDEEESDDKGDDEKSAQEEPVGQGDDTNETSTDPRGSSIDGSTRGSDLLAMECYVGQYPHWLMDQLLMILSRNPDTRLLNTQLAARLAVDIMVATNSTHWLLPRHAAVLQQIHSISTHQVMESMRGAMADVDLFIYVLEDEFDTFQRAKFPIALSFKSSSPFEFLVPPVVDYISDRNGTLNLRSPANEMEVCRKSMREFLTLRRLRQLVDDQYVADNLEQFVAFRHPHTSLLDMARTSGTTVSMEGMVFLKCIWREQRFLHLPAKLLMILNPEALVFAEKDKQASSAAQSDSDSETTEGVGFVRLFAPIHRTYCTVDSKDDRVLHVTISSAVPVDGCRSYHKGSSLVKGKSSQLGDDVLKSWHVSVLFDNHEDCKQAKAHVDLSRAEVRAFKLLQIEESLNTHVQITHSANAVSPKTKARRLSMDVEEKRLQQEKDEEEAMKR
ncbi:Clec16a protein, partial [Globisporangium splendens]